MGENTVGNRSPSRRWIKIGAQPISNVSVRINVAALGANVGYQRLTGWRDSKNAPQPVGLDPCAWRQMAGSNCHLMTRRGGFWVMAIVEIKLDAIESFADVQAFSEASSYLRI